MNYDLRPPNYLSTLKDAYKKNVTISRYFHLRVSVAFFYVVRNSRFKIHQ